MWVWDGAVKVNIEECVVRVWREAGSVTLFIQKKTSSMEKKNFPWMIPVLFLSWNCFWLKVIDLRYLECYCCFQKTHGDRKKSVNMLGMERTVQNIKLGSNPSTVKEKLGEGCAVKIGSINSATVLVILPVFLTHRPFLWVFFKVMRGTS